MWVAQLSSANRRGVLADQQCSRVGLLSDTAMNEEQHEKKQQHVGFPNFHWGFTLAILKLSIHIPHDYIMYVRTVHFK